VAPAVMLIRESPIWVKRTVPFETDKRLRRYNRSESRPDRDTARILIYSNSRRPTIARDIGTVDQDRVRIHSRVAFRCIKRDPSPLSLPLDKNRVQESFVVPLSGARPAARRRFKYGVDTSSTLPGP